MIQYYHKKDNESVVSELPTPLELFKQTHTKQEYRQLVSFYKSEQWQEVERAHLNSDRRYYERRAESGAENIGNSMHDNCIEENAKLHDKAGLDTYLVRDAGGGCCAWCAAIAGRYKYADAPDDVFRRHDHCTCTTTYECGKMRQDVRSKKNWEASPEELQARKEYQKVLQKMRSVGIKNQTVIC